MMQLLWWCRLTKANCFSSSQLIFAFLVFVSFRNKNRGKSIRKRIQASFRRKSARDKQKKLDQKHHCELEYSTASNNVEKFEKSAAGGSATPGQVTFESPQISRQNSTHSPAPRKSSAFLTVDESIRHLSISGEASSTEEEETTTG